MNYCQSCLVAKDISSCSEALTIGTGAADTAYTVYVKNLSTQRVDVFETVSTEEGLIIINTTNYTFNEGSPYEVWVTEQNASPNTHEEITVGDYTTTCIDFSAISYKNADDGCVKVIADEILIPEDGNEDFTSSENCFSICLLGKAEDVDFSTVHSFALPYESGRSLANILPLYASVEYVSGDFSDTNAQLIIKDTVNTYFNDLTGFDNSFISGVRKVMYLTTNPMNYIKTAALTVEIPVASTNPDTKASIFVYGIRI